MCTFTLKFAVIELHYLSLHSTFLSATVSEIPILDALILNSSRRLLGGYIRLLSFVLNNDGFSEKSELWFYVYRQIVQLFGVEFFQRLDSFDPIFHVLMARNKTSVHFYHLLLTMFWSLSSGLTVAINRIVGTKLSIVVIIILSVLYDEKIS